MNKLPIIRTLSVILGTLLVLLTIQTLYNRPPATPAPTWYGEPQFEAEERSLGRELSAAGYWYYPKISGLYYNFNDQGERFIPNTPGHPIFTIWFFGNSQLVAPFVSDGQTSLALVQALLPNFRIVNRSAGGQDDSGELAWLKETPTKHGDAVVFIGGSWGTVQDYARVVELAMTYAANKRLVFIHLIQPSKPGFSSVGRQSFSLPTSDFVDWIHLSSRGEVDLGLALYRVLTTL
jgi:hypothetical protein